MVSTQEFQRKVRNELERLFRAIDSDGSGALSSTEFDAVSETLIQVLGATSQDAPATAILKGMTAMSFDSIDLNQDQMIDFAEFETWVCGILAAIKKPEDYKVNALRFVVTEIARRSQAGWGASWARGHGQQVRVEVPKNSMVGCAWHDGGVVSRVTSGGVAAKAGVAPQVWRIVNVQGKKVASTDTAKFIGDLLAAARSGGQSYYLIFETAPEQPRGPPSRAGREPDPALPSPAPPSRGRPASRLAWGIPMEIWMEF